MLDPRRLGAMFVWALLVALAVALLLLHHLRASMELSGALLLMLGSWKVGVQWGEARIRQLLLDEALRTVRRQRQSPVNGPPDANGAPAS